MTDRELTFAVKAIWKRACEETAALVKSQKFKVFNDQYDFHRYVKHGDTHGLISSGEDLMRVFFDSWNSRRRKFVIATPENIQKEKDQCRRDAIKECRRQIDAAKQRIVENESFLSELLSDKKNIDYDAVG